MAKHLRDLNCSSMVLFDGVPRNVTSPAQRVDFAHQKWFSKHGMRLFNLDKMTAGEAEKLFEFIDYNRVGVVSRSQI